MKLHLKVKKLEASISSLGKPKEKAWWTPQDISDWVDNDMQEVKRLIGMLDEQPKNTELELQIEEMLNERFTSFMNGKLPGRELCES